MGISVQEMTKVKKSFQMIEKLAFICFAYVLFDCALFGSGHYIDVYGVTPRIFFGFLSILLSLPIFIRDWKDWIRNPIIQSLLIFAVILLYNSYIAIKNGNRIDVFLQDIKGFSWFLLLITPYSIIRSEKRIDFLLLMILFGGSIQATFVVLIHFLSNSPFLFGQIWELITNIGLGSISNVGGGVYRVSMGSIVYLIVAFVILQYLLAYRKIGKKYFLISPVLLFSILLSFTRSSIGATILVIFYFYSGILCVNLGKDLRKRIFYILSFTLIVSIVFIIFLQEILDLNFFGFLFQRTFQSFSFEAYSKSIGFSDYLEISKGSDSLRAQTVTELKELISKNILLGNGLGASVPSREDGFVEYFYLDLIAKTGVLGFAIYIYPFFLIGIRVLRGKYGVELGLLFFLFAGLVAFLSATYFNPYMNSALGIVFYILFISIEHWSISRGSSVE